MDVEWIDLDENVGDVIDRLTVIPNDGKPALSERQRSDLVGVAGRLDPNGHSLVLIGRRLM